MVRLFFAVVRNLVFDDARVDAVAARFETFLANLSEQAALSGGD
jgi:hypothetical protein